MSFQYRADEFVLKSDEADPALDVVTKALDDLRGSLDERVAEIERKAAEKLTSRLDKLEARLNRPAIVEKAGEHSVERKAFDRYLRVGEQRMAVDEIKAMTVASDAAGGYLAPEEIGSEFIKLFRKYSPLRQYARVVSIGAESVKYPRRTTSTTGYWVDETEDRTGTQMGVEQISITPMELAAFSDISTKLLEDNAYNLEGELTQDVAETFGILEGAAFVAGTGVKQPVGILTATGIAEIVTGDAAGFKLSNPADTIIAMFHALPSVHAQSGVWMANNTTIGIMRQWRDVQGRYLLADPISDNMPTTLLGRPIVEMKDMPNVAAGNYPIVFGDFQGYRIVDRVGLSTLRDPYTLATKGQVRFHVRKRVGADVTHPDRFIKLKVAAS